MSRISHIGKTEKISFLFDIDEDEANAVYERRAPPELVERIGSRTNLNLDIIRSILHDPQIVEDIRQNPNMVDTNQIKRIPGFKSELADRFEDGKPYNSIEELEIAIDLPRIKLDNIFEIPKFQFKDKIKGEKILLEPVSGRYIVPQSSGLEDVEEIGEEELEEVGYSFLQTKGTPNFRVLERLFGFEAAHLPHKLKKMFNGKVYPVLQDKKGFERFLVPGSIELWFDTNISAYSEDRCRSIIEKYGFQLDGAVPDVGYYRVHLTTDPKNPDLTRRTLTEIDRVQKEEEIMFAEPEYAGLEDFSPDIDVEENGGFEEVDRFWNHDIIDLAEAHTITEGSPDVTIFIIDTGCQMDHEELSNSFRQDWRELDLNFYSDVIEDKSPNETTYYHGTKVAGIIHQIAPGCKILPVRISDQFYTPEKYGKAAAAIKAVIDNYLGPSQRGVLNISWRTGFEHIGIRNALVEAQQKGVAVATSAGNYGNSERQICNDEHYPSGHVWLYPYLKTLCSVGAVAVGDRKASYSYFGSESVTFAAPGGESGGSGIGIRTTTFWDGQSPQNFVYTRGTSFAAPHVAGLIALIFSIRPEISAEEAIQAIKETADKIEHVNPLYPLGAGRINAYRALKKVLSSTSPAIQTHNITAIVSAGGCIIPDGVVLVNHGSSQTFTFTPDIGYQIVDVLIDSASIGPITRHTFHNVVNSHTIEAIFVAEQEVPIIPIRININSATVGMLITLPLIGPFLANLIVDYRNKYGPYTSIYQLALVGVSPWAISKMEELIEV